MMQQMFVLAAFAVLAPEPQSIQPAYDEQAILKAHGAGDQIYSCQEKNGGYAWVLKAPEAQLFSAEHKVVGRHFAGPSWEWVDKSSVTGKMISSSPSPDADAIPWLLINVTQHSGDGALGPVEAIQRINTKGGKAPASGCDVSHAGATHRVAYEADYVFYAKCRGKC